MLTPCAKSLWFQLSNSIFVEVKVYDKIRVGIRPEVKQEITHFVKTSVRRNLKI